MRAFFQAFDNWRERQAWLPAWLDDKAWKTWLWHSAICVVLGLVLSLLPMISVHLGMRLMVLYYGARESWGILVDGNKRYVDAAMDVLVPLVIIEAINLG